MKIWRKGQPVLTFGKRLLCGSQRFPSYIELTVVEFDSCVAMVTSAGLSSKSNFIKRASY